MELVIVVLKSYVSPRKNRMQGSNHRLYILSATEFTELPDQEEYYNREFLYYVMTKSKANEINTKITNLPVIGAKE